MLEQQNTIMIHSDRRHKEETQDHTDRSTDHLPHMRNAPMILRQKKKQPPAPPAPAPAPPASPPSDEPTQHQWPWYVWALIIVGILICLGQLSN